MGMERWEEQLQKEIDLLSTYLSHIQSDRNLEMILGRYEALKKRIRIIKESYLIEVQLVKDRVERREYERKLDIQSKRVDEIVMKIERAIQVRQKKHLLKEETNLSEIETTTGDQMLKEAKQIQNNTKYSLIRTRETVEQSTVVAASTLENLESQREQLQQIGNNVSKMESNLERSKILIVDYARVIASDPICQAFTTINSLLLLFIILYILVTEYSNN